MIKIDKYAITADSQQFKLSDVVTVKEGKHEGEERLINTTYHMNINSLFKSIEKRELFDITKEASKIEHISGDFQARISLLEKEISDMVYLAAQGKQND